MLLSLQKGLIYGPVSSRRLGQSLGINLLPSGKKVCSFNCLYCQYGWSEVYLAGRVPAVSLASGEDVRKALIEALRSLNKPPSYITFSGNGEPTLHPDFGQIVQEVISIRNELFPSSRTAILSNSSMVTTRRVREAIEKLDVRIMKLDCGTDHMFRKYNRPCSGAILENITEGLTQIPGITIQTLISKGQSGNLEAHNIREWIKRLREIKPAGVQLYTMDRGYPSEDLKPASREELNRIAHEVQQAGIDARVY